MLAGVGGGIFDGNCNYQPENPNGYLTMGNHFWTMTPVGSYNPFGVTNWYSNVFTVNTSGNIDDYGTSDNYGLRPVINIKNNVTITGAGTIANPYKIADLRTVLEKDG